ncbi:hypothetical protein ABIA06_003289 [Bradyrhizobium yuanmingense]|uniref:hypothetical protein n=1 Tax=Bradyrhizobium yuanmingense TaxID=108015 RepID=UPI003516F0D7
MANRRRLLAAAFLSFCEMIDAMQDIKGKPGVVRLQNSTDEKLRLNWRHIVRKIEGCRRVPRIFVVHDFMKARRSRGDKPFTPFNATIALYAGVSSDSFVKNMSASSGCLSIPSGRTRYKPHEARTN